VAAMNHADRGKPREVADPRAAHAEAKQHKRQDAADDAASAPISLAARDLPPSAAAM